MDKGRGMYNTSILPNVAPMKNKGVTSPPLKPTLKVKLVSNSFIKKSYCPAGFSKAFTISGMPNPIKELLEVDLYRTNNNSPPKKEMSSGLFILLKSIFQNALE